MPTAFRIMSRTAITCLSLSSGRIAALSAPTRHATTMNVQASRQMATSDQGRGSPTKRQEHIVLTKDQTRSTRLLDASIAEIRTLSPTVKGFAIDVQDAARESFLSGQWVDFVIPEVAQVGGYSICSTPRKLKEEGQIDLAVKSSEWPPAKWMHQKAKVGDKVQIKFGGDFHYPNKRCDEMRDHDVLLIAGGVGINPIFSILQFLLGVPHEGRRPMVKLLYSVQSDKELIFKDIIEELVQSQPEAFRATYFVTRPRTGTTFEGNSVRQSRIEDESLQEALSDMHKEKVMCFICGPNPMIEQLNESLLRHGLPQENIFYELWW